jgi:hypothetical protein
VADLTRLTSAPPPRKGTHAPLMPVRRHSISPDRRTMVPTPELPKATPSRRALA